MTTVEEFEELENIIREAKRSKMKMDRIENITSIDIRHPLTKLVVSLPVTSEYKVECQNKANEDDAKVRTKIVELGLHRKLVQK